METEFFKTDDGIYHKIERDYDSDPLNPRKNFDNLGKMVFKEQSRYKLGDEQVSDLSDFFVNQLSGGQGDERKIKGKIVVDIPTLSEALNHRVLNKLYVAGTDEIGFHFDIDKFYQDFEAQLSSICDTYRKLGFVDDIVCNIPFDENHTNPVTVKLFYLKPMYYEEYKDMKTVDIAAEVKRRIEEAITKYTETA